MPSALVRSLGTGACVEQAGRHGGRDVRRWCRGGGAGDGDRREVRPARIKEHAARLSEGVTLRRIKTMW